MSSLPAIPKIGLHRNASMLRDSRRPVPAVTGMMVALAVLAREPLLICLRRLFWKPRKNSATEQAARLLSLPSLRQAIVGRSRQSVTHLFGPPPTCTDGQCPVWYYPVSARDRLAMAISFHDGRAVIVEFFQAPQDQ